MQLSDEFKAKLYKVLYSFALQRVLGLILFFAVTAVLMFGNFNPQQVMFRPDEVAERNIQAKSTAVITDEKETEQLRQQAASKVQKVYQEDREAMALTRSEITGFFNAIRDILAQPEFDQVQLEYLLTSSNIKSDQVQLEHNLEELVEYLANNTSQDLDQLRISSLSMAQSLMGKPVTDEAVDDMIDQANSRISSLSYPSQSRDIIKIACINALRPNLVFNQEATDRAFTEAIEAVQPVQKTIKAGEVIVRQGERVTAEQISILEQLGIQRSKSYPLSLLGLALFLILTFWLVLGFIRHYYADIYSSNKSMCLLGIVVVTTLILTKFLTMLTISDQYEINALVGYLTTVAAGSMLIAILLDNRLAYFITMIMAIYVGMMADGNQFFYAIVAFAGGTIGVFRVTRLSQTSDISKAGLYIALANIISIITLTLINGNINWNLVGVGVAIGAVSGILSAILMIGTLSYLESIFSITSMIKLLELSNPNTPLLKQLLLEAPGTYHHSLMVGNLAEASAESVGANPLLVRAGAYYHDIGKIKRPDYFVENQHGFDNPHEKIAPALSALIIISHIRDGVELAREARLPEAIIEFIEQHHGTSLTKYFYNKALEENPESNIKEDNFRYEGPKPHSKEIALVMLADSVEAAVRSLNEPTLQKIRDMVRKIIREKYDDEQLELCELTFKDLDTLSDSFCRVLEGVYHKRIEYPEVIVKELEKRRETSWKP